MQISLRLVLVSADSMRDPFVNTCATVGVQLRKQGNLLKDLSRVARNYQTTTALLASSIEQRKKKPV
eukprot:snap_masked-scaffold_1-processed-gene-28.14-mRNA-1 protein AED:1.00 eAED:1.00 QI:0/0/0/0/1/1/2/0/66